MRLDDPRLAELAGGDRGPVGGRLVRRGVGRPPAVHRRGAARGRRGPPRPPQALPADLRPVRRAALLRRRRPAPGGAVAPRASASGSACARTSGTCPCRSCSRSTARRSSSTCRRRRAATWRPRNEVGLGTATSWRTLMRTYAQLTTSFVVFCNRVGVDESISFWGGSEVIAPTGAARLQRAALRRGPVHCVDIAPADVRRERIALPLLRDERPELQRPRAGADRRRARGHGARLDRRARAPSPGSTSRPATRRRSRSASGATRRHRERGPAGLRAARRSSRSTPTSRGGSSASSSAASSRQAGFERARPRAVGRHRLGARGVPRGRGDRRRAAAVRADAVPDVVAGVARPTPRRSSPRSAARQRARRHQPDGRRLLRRAERATPSPLRRGNFMARMRMTVLYDRSVTWGGLVVGTGNKTESLIGYTTIFGDNACAFNPIGDLYKSQVRQRRGRDRACPTRSSARRRRPTCGRARPTRPRPGFSYPELDRLLFWRIDQRRSIDEVVALGFDRGDGRAGRPDGRRRRVQAPGAADRQARAADGRRRLPLPAPAAGLGRGLTRGRAAEARRRRDPVRRRDADREPRRHHAAGARGAARRAAHRGRGHAADAAAAGPPRDRRRGSTSYHAQSGPARARRAAGAPARRRGPGARHRRRHAARQRPGRRARGRLGGGGRARSCRSRARRPCWPRSWPAASPGRAGRSRGSCRAPGASGGSGWPRIAADDAGHGPVRGAGPGRGHAARPGRGLRAGSRRARCAAS